MAEEKLQFHEMGLDDRVLKAVADLGWSQPTLIQEKAIPLALEGKDLLARARTGSGKTAAYAVPVIQRILTSKQSVREQDVRALILVPTKELGRQVQTMMKQLTVYCSRDVRVADISGKADLSAQRPILMEKPDVVVGTPSRVLAHLNAQNLVLHSSLETLVVDEADLLFSFGFEADLKNLLCHLPKIYQSFLMSATLTEDVQALKELLLHNPVMSKLQSPYDVGVCVCDTDTDVILKLQGSQLPDSSQLQQYSIKCEEEDKFLLIYTLLKLHLVQGKTLLFVGTVDRCYRLKLFLEQFGIPACVLNSELPGFYDYIIATDEQSLTDPSSAPQTTSGKGKKSKSSEKGGQSKDKEYGVSRGVDFQNVANVINFDFPTTIESYIHRPGGKPHTSSSHTVFLYDVITADENGESVLKPYEFKMEEIEGFRYRCRDAMRSVTKQAVREARLKEIKQELLNSEKLKTYFEDNPRDLQLLRHDKDLHPAVVKPHLKNVPDYLIPETLKGVVNPLSSRRSRKRKEKSKSDGVAKPSFKKNVRGKNPLKSFRYTGGRSRKGKAGRS
ncbi:hypothetical protein INR49_019732 [Caranx melampygus]|nr:hypothetical protein INR49_019732 [Caranx melampygus]